MDTLLSILAVLFGVVGCVGCIVPVLPGVMLAYAGYLSLYFCSYSTISLAWLVVFGVLTLAVSLLDYLLPSYMTRKFGGTKAGERGAMAGVIAGMFFGPIGIIVAPFVGAVVAELIYDSSDKERAFKSGFGSFLSFFVGTGIKLALSMWMTIRIVVEICKHIL
ncbi:MAG: DUF456 domain-containing protein [Rikenellaceae bacterium]|nr:DUF456 domain-containing protein [Rikenellaceae bacterium]